MDNAIFGVIGIARGISLGIRQLFYFELFQGFLLGFFLATLLYAFLVSGSVKQVPYYLLRDSSQGFQKAIATNKEGSYGASYAQFKKIALRARVLLYVFLITFLALIIIAVLRFA